MTAAARPLTSTADAVVALLAARTRPDAADVAPLLAGGQAAADLQVVHDVLSACWLSRPEVQGWRTDPAERLTVVTMRSPLGVVGDLYLTEGSAGELVGVRLDTPAPAMTGPHALVEALRPLEVEVSVVADDPLAGAPDDRVRAISSVAKVFVLLAVLDAVAEGGLTLEHRHQLQESDLSLLSFGLTARHVGTRLTVADLCRLMVLHSDNTATDVLIGLVGPRAVVAAMASCGVPAGLNDPLRTTRQLIEAAWGESSVPSGVGSDGPLRDRSLAAPVHHAGLDYLAPLTAVTEAMHRLSAVPWTPWSDQPLSAAARDRALPRPPLMYKGGSAPGVLAGAWCRRTPTGPRALAFAINSTTPLGALEELFAFTCAERALQELGIR